MNTARRPDFLAVVLAPEAGDDPEDLEDLIHDEITKGRVGKGPDERGEVVNVVLDLTGCPEPQVWLKAVGPAVPDANLRLVVSPKAFAVARLLGLPALLDLYPDVESALRQGV
ncbi:MAG: hypothetical protein D6731_05385 [Planctomycetota bacterium]|nr:MAG: hypothetical protein D6731_05385 [Planctomycetota bacterium]